MAKFRVEAAEPHYTGCMNSHSMASNILLRQWRFPDTYDEKEPIASTDHDRILDQKRDHWSDCVKRVDLEGKGFHHWLRYGKVTHILAFLVDVLEVDKSVKWTGFRIIGSINRSSGYEVYSLQIFAKGKKSKTKVYSGEDAPNVIRQGWGPGDDGPFYGMPGWQLMTDGWEIM